MTLIDHTTDLVLSAPVNLRDLGGTPVAGGAVRRGFAIRADDLSLADEASARRLVEDGLAAVIDLRSSAELEVTGRGPLRELPVSYHHVPFMADIGQATRESRTEEGVFDQPGFESMYIGLYENASPQIVTALAIIAHTPGAVAFHCAAGQDRTGVMAAALLLTLGAGTDDIVADYARTGPNSEAIGARTRPVIGPLLARLGFDLDEAARSATRAEFSPAPMSGLLAHLERTHGDPLAPLRDAGLSDALVTRLRQRALDG